MDRITFFSQVGADGMLHLSVPVGPELANQQVQLTVEPAAQKRTAKEYTQWLEHLAGSWQGEFVPGGEGTVELREALN